MRVANMVRNRCLAKSINDAGWAVFRSILTSKAADAGKLMIAVPAQYISQNCSGMWPDGNRCAERVPKSWSVRSHLCPRCGLVLDRDENAARSIVRVGHARQARTWPTGPSAA